jgi:hypothetical protein
MNLIGSITPRLAAAAATVAAGALAVQAVLQLTDQQSSESTAVGIEHVTLAAFSIGLIALIPVVLHLGRLAGRIAPAAVASGGMLALGLLATISNVRGSDPSFFAAVAAPANLVWLGGFVALAVALRRSGRVSALVAFGLPVSWALYIPLSLLGGGLLGAAYWLLVARTLSAPDARQAQLAVA